MRRAGSAKNPPVGYWSFARSGKTFYLPCGTWMWPPLYYSRQEDPANNNLFKYYGRTGAISGSTVTFLPSFAVSDTPSLPEFGRDSLINSVYMGDYNTAFATAGAFHAVWSDNRDDLPGGAFFASADRTIISRQKNRFRSTRNMI